MADVTTTTLGQRIVEAARLAMVAHLCQAQALEENVGRREAAGGAGSGAFMDEARLPSGGRRRRRRRDSEERRGTRRRPSRFDAEGEAR